MQITHGVAEYHPRHGRIVRPYLDRAIGPTLKSRLSTFPVVVLTGARQTGKSTLAQREFGADRSYLTLDDFEVLDQARNAPDALVRRAPRLTIDEVQRAPELLLAIKRAVDQDRRPGRFLLTGSANLALMESVSESLAGRAVYLTLGPMTRRELVGKGTAGCWDMFLDAPPDQWLERVQDDEPPTGDDWREVALRGGFPVPALEMSTATERAVWFEGYQRTYLERDLQQLSAIENLVGFQRLVRASAQRIGGLQNQADLARDAGLPPTTAQRYLDLLETSYQVVRVEPYSVNRTKRLVKSPRIYWTDAGLGLHLAGTEPRGAHLENLIISDLLVWRESRVRRTEVLFWRTSAGAEVDIVLETPDRLLPIEVKSSAKPRARDARHLELFLDEYPDQARAGLLLHGGADAYPLTDRVVAVPWDRVI